MKNHEISRRTTSLLVLLCGLLIFFQFSDQENFFSLSKVKFISDAQFNQARTSRV